jgi:uncharacterized membrane protein YkvA (DUF1232 family)
MSAPVEGEILGPDDPAARARDAETVAQGFWPKLKAVARKLPFARDLVAAYYCAVDPNTPTRVKGILLAALAYFVLPVDMVPDILLGIGFTDDATVLATAIALVARHIRPEHRAKADAALADSEETPA